MDRGLFNEWAAALRGIADEMETVAGINLDIVPERRTAHQPTKIIDFYRQTYYETGGDATSMFRTLKRSFDNETGPVKIVRLDKSEVIVSNMEEVFSAFGQ